MSASLTESDLGVVYSRARPGLIRLAVLLLDDLAAAEDVVQDVFARVHQKRPPVDSLERYLTTAVLNTARSLLRRRRVAANALVRLRTHEPVSAPGADELTPEQARVWAAITRLPLRQRQVVVCRFSTSPNATPPRRWASRSAPSRPVPPAP